MRDKTKAIKALGLFIAFLVVVPVISIFFMFFSPSRAEFPYPSSSSSPSLSLRTLPSPVKAFLQPQPHDNLLFRLRSSFEKEKLPCDFSETQWKRTVLLPLVLYASTPLPVQLAGVSPRP